MKDGGRSTKGGTREGRSEEGGAREAWRGGGLVIIGKWSSSGKGEKRQSCLPTRQRQYCCGTCQVHEESSGRLRDFALTSSTLCTVED